MSLKINIFFRKRLSQYNSIEELFLGLKPLLEEDASIETLEVPYSGGHPKSLIKNINWAKSRKRGVNHITGDIHYLVLAFGKSSVLTIHDIRSALKGSLLKRFYITLFWFWLPAVFVKRITVISEFTKYELAKIIPFAKHKIRVVHNPVNSKIKPSVYEFNTQKPTILFIGTKDNKNLERSLEAIKNLDCKVTITGLLSLEQLQLLDALKIDYENHSRLDFSDIINCYKTCDLVCFASTYEGFGMPIIEAQATGRPVLTSNFGAMAEVAEQSACLVDPYDVKSISKGIEQICNDALYRNELIEKGFENVKRFQAETIAKDYIAIYKEVVK